MQPVINNQYRKCKGHVETGMVLIVLGTVFLAMKFNLLQIEWRWYMFAALAFATIGLVELLHFKPHKVFEGLSKIALGAWFYAAFSGLWGINPANSWPLILIIVGIGLVAKSLFKTKSPIQENSKSE